MTENSVNKSVASDEKTLTTAQQLSKLERENKELRIRLEGEGDNAGIPLDAYIEVMSLVPFKLNLSTERLGKGRQFSFSRYGEIKRILYNDLASIFENYRTFMEQGYFYILNPKVVRKHGLDDIYEKILTKENIDNILTFDPKSAVKLYESASESQREIIDGMLIKIVKDNEISDVDFNVISQVSKIGGSDILKIAQEMKDLEAEPEQ